MSTVYLQNQYCMFIPSSATRIKVNPYFFTNLKIDPLKVLDFPLRMIQFFKVRRYVGKSVPSRETRLTREQQQQQRLANNTFLSYVEWGLKLL